MGKSYSTATRAYKTGLKLVLDSSEEDYQVALLVSLSKIASTSSALISDQVGLLFLFLSREKSMRVRATALRCLLFILSKGLCQFSVNAEVVKVLFSMLDEPELPTSMQCEALRILRKMIIYMPSLPRDIDLDKLLTIAENASAIYVLVDISKRYKEIRDMNSNVSCSSPIPSQVVSLIFRLITALVKPLSDPTDSVKFQDINNLLNLLLSIVQDDRDLAVLVLDQVCVFVRHLSSTNDNSAMDIDTLVHENVDIEGEKSKTIRLKLACNVYRFLVIFLECLSEAGAITMPIFDKVKLVSQYVCKSKLFDCYTHAIYSMLLHSPAFCGCNTNKSEESCNLEGKSDMFLHNCSVEKEVILLEFANKILSENKNWPAYKVGIHSACQGLWFTSSLIFQHLITQVTSDACCSWLKSVLQFSSSGRKIMLVLLMKNYSSVADMSQTTKIPLRLLCSDVEEIGREGTDLFCESNCSKVVLSAYKSICSSKETLEVGLKTGQEFCFQRWFLSLRAKALRAVVDVFDILETVPFLWEKNSGNEQVEKGFVVECLLSLIQVSFRLKRLAKEFDLLSASFIDMESRSLKIISALALSSSLLAFITGFSLFIPTMHKTFISGLKKSENILCADLVQNLSGRLWYIDHEISTKLCQLIDVSKHTDINCFHLQSRNQAFNFGCEARDILTVCRYAVSEIFCLRSEADRSHDEENRSRVIKDGLRLTQKLLFQWMQIPFKTPNYFFRLRPCIGSELFAVGLAKNPDGIYALPGYHLPLSVCLQLRNVPPNLPVRLAKFYCLLYCRVSCREPKAVQESNEQSRSSYQAGEADDTVEMNEKLLHYVTKCAAQKMDDGKSSTSGTNDCGFVSSFFCCEPNESGQGFSSCLLDVSAFPPGSYRIRWQSSCIDNQGNYWNLLPLTAGPLFTIQ